MPQQQQDDESPATHAASETERKEYLRDEDEPSLYCPRCDSRLAEMKCKLVCQKCGYYMSCADYY
jgi:ribosomal protein S27AE